MGRKHTPGLYKRRSFWHVDKRLFGRRVCKNTGTGSLEEAEKYLARTMEKMRAAEVFGIRPARTFREAAKKYLRENMHKTRINDDAMHITQLDKYIGTLPLNKIHNGTLAPFVAVRQKQGRKSKTINLALGVVRHMLNLAAHEWMDESGLTWLTQASKIKMLPVRDARKPYPLSWDEQTRRSQARMPDKPAVGNALALARYISISVSHLKAARSPTKRSAVPRTSVASDSCRNIK